MHPCWPQVLGEKGLRARVLNFAQAGSLVTDLHGQGSRAIGSSQVPKAAGGLLKRETLVVVHSCGNDFIQKMVEGVFSGGTPELFRANPGVREAEAIKRFLELMYRGGARHFLVSGVPAFPEMPIWRMVWPVLTGLVAQGRLTELGVGPGDDPRLALDVQISALHDRWEGLCTEFKQNHSDVHCAFFDEVSALEKLRGTLGPANFDRQMWDFSMFHPTAYGHVQLAGEAHRCVALQFPELGALAPHPEVRAASAPASAPLVAAVPRPAAPAVNTAPAVRAAAAALWWLCGSCTLMNDADRTVCEACEAVRPAAPAAAPPPAVQAEAPRPIVVRIRNVKGDVGFAATCDAGATVNELKAAVLSAAPTGFYTEGHSLVLALNGKFLAQGGAKLSDVGVKDNSQLIAVVRPPAAAAAPASPAAAAEPASPPQAFVPPPRS